MRLGLRSLLRSVEVFLAMDRADHSWTTTCRLNYAIRESPAPHVFTVDRTLMHSLTPVDAAEEPPSSTTESAVKLECNISISTNFLLNGIQEVRFCHSTLTAQALDQDIEKHSPSLARTAIYHR
jgi:ubiquitin carboxyl-terminal hydrolase 14